MMQNLTSKLEHNVTLQGNYIVTAKKNKTSIKTISNVNHLFYLIPAPVILSIENDDMTKDEIWFLAPIHFRSFKNNPKVNLLMKKISEAKNDS